MLIYSQIVNLDGLQLSFTIKDSDFHQISMILKTLKNQYEALAYKINEHYVKISLIGSGMRDMSGVASKHFDVVKIIYLSANNNI